MRPAVAEKLFRVINWLPHNERDVVYAFVKIRKLLEFDDSKKAYPFLSVLCDWLLHTKLNRSGARAVLEILDEQLIQKRWHPTREDVDDRAFDVFSLDLFRHDLGRFLTAQNLPTVWVDDMFAWQALMVFYGEEVRDTPLVMKRGAGTGVFLRQLVIEACEPSAAVADANPKKKLSGFKWALTLNSGQRFVIPYTFELGTPPDGWKPFPARFSQASALAIKSAAS